MATNKPIPKPMPKPNLSLKQKLAQVPLDSVRNPNFDAAMAQQNYANVIAEQRARVLAERGTPSADPTAPPYLFDESKRRAGKEIILSFSGGQYGSVNDKAANEIAKKYNLDIVDKPNPNKEGGLKIYRFSVKGNVDKGLSGIKNEPGVEYAEANSRSFIPEQGPDPFITYEDNRMRAALNGEELPTPPAGYVEGFDRSKKNLTPPMIGGTDKFPPQGPQVGSGQRPSDRFDDYRGQLPQVGGGPDFIQEDPNRKYTADMINYIDPATGERTSRTRGVVPGPGSRFVPANQAGMYGQRPPQGPGGGMGGAQDYGIDYIEGGQKYAPMTPTPSQFAQFQQGAMASQYSNQQPPQASQGAQSAMATYNNLLQQGMQRSNAMNQDAATNFANLQAGAPTIPTTSTANIPAAGFGMQKPKAQTFKVQQGFPSVKAF